MEADGDSIVLFKPGARRKREAASYPVKKLKQNQQERNEVAPAPELPERGRGEASTSAPGSPGSKEPGEEASFKDLGLTDWLVSVLASLGITQPTPVQRGCIPAALAGRDVIGTAQTGSGKTAAFALPILQKLARDPYGVFALVLTPTRCAAGQGARGGREQQHTGLAQRARLGLRVDGPPRALTPLHRPPPFSPPPPPPRAAIGSSRCSWRSSSARLAPA
jgi:hypothetical protein